MQTSFRHSRHKDKKRLKPLQFVRFKNTEKHNQNSQQYSLYNVHIIVSWRIKGCYHILRLTSKYLYYVNF